MSISASPSERRKLWARLETALLIILLVGASVFVVVKVSAPHCDPPVGMSAPGPASGTVEGAGIHDAPPPWPAEPSTLASRMQLIQMSPVDTSAPTALPTRRLHIDVVIDGKPITIPARIGDGQGLTAPIRTTDSSGVVTLVGTGSFSLRDFFAVWGVRFSANRIGNLCNDGERVLRVFVDGRANIGDLSNVPLAKGDGGDQVLIVFGTPAQHPSPMPTSYPFAT